MRLTLPLLLASTVGLCQETPQPIYQPGNGVSRPEILKHTDPGYSEEARIARLTGRFTVSSIVAADGTVHDPRAPASPGLGLDENAVEAVRSWRFNPALKDGTPVAVVMNAEMNFHLGIQPGDWALSRAAFALPDGTRRPVLIAAPYPASWTTKSRDGSATISFEVASDGRTANLHVEQSSDSASETEVISIVRGWQFQPGARDGKPVPVRCTMEFAKVKGRTVR